VASRRQVIFTQIVNRAAKGESRFLGLLLEHASAIDSKLHNETRLSPEAMEFRIRKALWDN
jgi:hypothetical protein